MFKFKFNDIVHSLDPVVGNVAGTYGSIFIYNKTAVASPYRTLPLVSYKDTTKPLGYSDGVYSIYYCSNYPSIHCRKNNTNYSCCNNYQYYTTHLWTFDYAYIGSYVKAVWYAKNSYLGSSYNKYKYQTELAPYGIVSPSRIGYTFKGWNTSADDTGSPYKHAGVTRPTNSDATFYALWARIDAGTYGDQQFLDLLEDWFGGLPGKDAVSSVKFSNHSVKLTIGSTAVTVSVGTTLQLSHPTSNFGYDQNWSLVINGVAYVIRWANWLGQGGGPGTIVVSNGWLTDIYTPDIAKGTFSPSSFKNLIEQYISVNGSRTVSQAFTALVNGVSVHVPAGGTLYYRHPYTSNPDVNVYYVGFGSYDENPATIAKGSFVNHRTYCVYNSSSDTVYNYFNKYTDYPITITSDIKFN